MAREERTEEIRQHLGLLREKLEEALPPNQAPNGQQWRGGIIVKGTISSSHWIKIYEMPVSISTHP